jgi:polyhydroxyalkanoate synthesis regulator phasin
MKAKTFLELMTLSTNLYMLTQDEALMAKLKGFMEQGKNKIDEFVSEPVIDENGNELEFVDKLLKKAHEAREDMNTKVEEMVTALYNKMNIAHTDEIKGLELRIEELSRQLALAEARNNHLEVNKEL